MACLLYRCVLAELFLEGQPLFELSQLLAYRRGQYDPIHTLEKVSGIVPCSFCVAQIILVIGPAISYALSFIPSVFLPNSQEVKKHIQSNVVS